MKAESCHNYAQRRSLFSRIEINLNVINPLGTQFLRRHVHTSFSGVMFLCILKFGGKQLGGKVNESFKCAFMYHVYTRKGSICVKSAHSIKSELKILDNVGSKLVYIKIKLN